MDLESQAILSLYVIKNDLKKIPNYGIISKNIILLSYFYKMLMALNKATYLF